MKITRTQYKYYFLEWMHILLGNPSKKEFCKICKITQKEIDEFIFTNYPFPVPWLGVLYKYTSAPKDFAFLSIFIKKIYGVTPEKKQVSIPHSYNRTFMTMNYDK